MELALIDIVLLGVLLLSGLIGLWRGLVLEVMSLLSWISAFWVALAFGDDLLPWVGQWIDSAALAGALAYVGLFMLTLLVGGALTWLLSRLVKSTGLSGSDRSFGMLFGLLRGLAIAAALLLVLQLTPLSRQPAWAASTLVPVLQPAADWLRSWIPLEALQRIDAPLPLPLPPEPADSPSST